MTAEISQSKISDKITDERVPDVRCSDDSLIVDLMDGRSISVPLAWYPRLHGAQWNSAPIWRSQEAATASIGPISMRI